MVKFIVVLFFTFFITPKSFAASNNLFFTAASTHDILSESEPL